MPTKLRTKGPLYKGNRSRGDVDTPNPSIERGFTLPWSAVPEASWRYFECTVGIMLDSGLVVHNRLPQVNRLADTLATAQLDNLQLPTIDGPGVNLKCNDQYADIVQRMGHARYWFRLWGRALRIGRKVPIPGMKSIGGVPAVPYDKNPQWAFNRIAPGGNIGGVIMWYAEWSLWYTTLQPPINQTFPQVDPMAGVVGTQPPPDGIQAPYSPLDDGARNTIPPISNGIAAGGTSPVPVGGIGGGIARG